MNNEYLVDVLREHIERYRVRAEFLKSKEKESSGLYEYYAGRIDSYDSILNVLSDFD